MFHLFELEPEICDLPFYLLFVPEKRDIDDLREQQLLAGGQYPGLFTLGQDYMLPVPLALWMNHTLSSAGSPSGIP